jgi:hypothetical protein
MATMRVYLDTSVVGGTCDDEYSVHSLALVDALESGRLVAIVSDILIGEIALAPDRVQQQLLRIMQCRHERVGEETAALDLRDAYLQTGVLPRPASDDALHVAYATITRADVIATWNMKHLANPARARAFNGVNISHGYGLVVITTPRELIAMVEAEDEAD